MLTEAHGWEPHSTNAITTKTTYWKLKPRLGTRSHHKGTKFYLHYNTHDRQQLRVPQLANHSFQKWYGMEELLERSPTLPQTYQKMAVNDGNLPEKLTVNSTRVRKTKVDNRENISLSLTTQTQTTQKQENEYEVKPQYEELSKQLIMQNAIINAMKCMRAIKDRISRPVYQLANHLSPASIPRTVYQPGKSSVRDLQSPSAHHSSVVFRHNQSVGHHSDDSVGIFRHDASVGQSQRGSQSGHQSICQSGSRCMHVLEVYVGINNKGKAQNQEELLPRSSKLTDEQPDQISQESSNEQQLCASSSIRTTATNKVAIEKGTLKEPSATKIVQNRG
ncbi:hypothetical protein F511_01679 [Dorcoceras hygrometricum]|nr:hypothetical protein F511_01679 [Dorcoceras hygrometricum]